EYDGEPAQRSEVEQGVAPVVSAEIAGGGTGFGQHAAIGRGNGACEQDRKHGPETEEKNEQKAERVTCPREGFRGVGTRHQGLPPRRASAVAGSMRPSYSARPEIAP